MNEQHDMTPFRSALCFAYLGSALREGGPQRAQATMEAAQVRPRFPVSASNSMFEGPKHGSGGFAERDFSDDEE